jgi:hypothetical protein
MKRLVVVVPCLALLAAGAATGTGASAIPPPGDRLPEFEWTNAKHRPFPGGRMRCAKKRGARVCYQERGDKLWVKDTRKDGNSAVGKWEVRIDRRRGYCRNRHGVGSWGVCNEQFHEGIAIELTAGMFDRDRGFRGQFVGRWSKTRLARTGPPPRAASAHPPGASYGGRAKRLCGPAARGMVTVGATRVSCRIARKVASGRVLRGKRYRRWRCPGTRKGTPYGHCHGKGRRRGAIVHWGLRD